MLRFVLCADDYAFSPAVSRGILEALAAGRISATGVMTTRPSWAADAPALRAYDGRADIGLHLNLTAGAPITAMPVLAPRGIFPPLRQLLSLAARGKLPEGEIANEIDAQIEAFTAHMGRPPDFVDGHQHVHLPRLPRRALLQALARRGLAGKTWLRDAADRSSAILRRRLHAIKALFVAGLARGFAREAAAAGFACNQGFAGFSDFSAVADPSTTFASCLVAPGHRHLVMCHPGHVDAQLAGLDGATRSRERELAFLLSSAFAALLARAGARVSRFGELGA